MPSYAGVIVNNSYNWVCHRKSCVIVLDSLSSFDILFKNSNRWFFRVVFFSDYSVQLMPGGERHQRRPLSFFKWFVCCFSHFHSTSSYCEDRTTDWELRRILKKRTKRCKGGYEQKALGWQTKPILHILAYLNPPFIPVGSPRCLRVTLISCVLSLFVFTVDLTLL